MIQNFKNTNCFIGKSKSLFPLSSVTRFLLLPVSWDSFQRYFTQIKECVCVSVLKHGHKSVTFLSYIEDICVPPHGGVLTITVWWICPVVPRQVHKRPQGFHLVFWSTLSWSPELPYENSGYPITIKPERQLMSIRSGDTSCWAII
jgi:hypothetical protein